MCVLQSAAPWQSSSTAGILTIQTPGDSDPRRLVAFVATIFLAVVAAIFGLPLRSTAQGISQSVQVSGYVRDAASHEPIVSARIDLMSPAGIAAPTQYSDTNGEFHFDRVPDGTYRAIVRKSGYAAAQAEISVVGGHQSHVEVDLQRETSNSNEANGNGPTETISEHELTVPQRARDDYAKGKDLLAKNDYPGAVAQFQKAVDEFPSFYEAYAKLGVAQYMSGQASQAHESFQKSIDLSGGKYSEALFDLADVMNDTRDFQSAERLARQEISIDEASWKGYFQLARAQLGQRRLPDAEKSAQKARDLNAQNRQTYVILTNVHIGLRDYPSVLQDIDAYLKLDPTGPAADQMRSTRAQVAKAIASGAAKQEQNKNPNQDQKPQ